MATPPSFFPRGLFWRPRWCPRCAAGAGGGRAIRPVMPGPRSLPLRGYRGGRLTAAAWEAPGREEMITMMFWNGAGWAWWQAGLMWAGMIAFWGLLIWLVYALFTGATRRD